jgi:hypothetical protein
MYEIKNRDFLVSRFTSGKLSCANIETPSLTSLFQRRICGAEGVAAFDSQERERHG